MGIASRIARILKANLNEMLSRAENPEKMLSQAIGEMEDSLREARETITQAVADEKKLARQLAEARELETRWAERAEQAVEAGDEILAREAIRKRRMYSDLVLQYEDQLAEQREAVDRLKASYAQLEERLQDARARRRELLARHRRVRHPAEAGGRRPLEAEAVFDTRAFDEFDRMAAKIEDLEYYTEAAREIESDLSGYEEEYYRPPRPRRPRPSEEELAIDLELAELKKKVGRAPRDEEEEGEEEGGPPRRVEL
ncbi:MAG TPA: hypothetical protein EYP85_00120 [Armatimonadetes bacterium]|nr:hypothetical protein [Armatimonadota bacterium]